MDPSGAGLPGGEHQRHRLAHRGVAAFLMEFFTSLAVVFQIPRRHRHPEIVEMLFTAVAAAKAGRVKSSVILLATPPELVEWEREKSIGGIKKLEST